MRTLTSVLKRLLAFPRILPRFKPSQLDISEAASAVGDVAMVEEEETTTLKQSLSICKVDKMSGGSEVQITWRGRTSVGHEASRNGGFIPRPHRLDTASD